YETQRSVGSSSVFSRSIRTNSS
ncbi:unnamed protein product, partial [Rotaria sp. Silwood2]